MFQAQVKLKKTLIATNVVSYLSVDGLLFRLETHDCKDKVPSRCPRLKEEGYCKSVKPDVRLNMRNMCALTCGFCSK